MATSKIQVGIIAVSSHKQISVTANTVANCDVSFTAPSNSTLMLESVDYVSASQNSSSIKTFIPIVRNAAYTRYRIVSVESQNVDVYATRLYKVGTV